MNSLQENIREKKDLKLFEIEKVFKLPHPNPLLKGEGIKIEENYEVASVITSEADIPYYEIQTIVSDYLKTI
jgi:hypothetical protein